MVDCLAFAFRCGQRASGGTPVLDEAGFDAFVEEPCAKFYADGVCRPRPSSVCVSLSNSEHRG